MWLFLDMTSEEDVGSGSRLRGQPRKYKIRKSKASKQTKAIAIAAGDEDTREELLPGDMDTGDTDALGLLPEVDKNEVGDRLRSSISDDIAKSYREPSLFSDTAVELFEKVWSGVEQISLMPSWSESATEYFKTLTLNAQKLVGYVVPWDSEMLNTIMSYSQGGECSLPNLGPVLKLNLYDVSNDIDVFINAAMVQAEYATSSSIKHHEEKVGRSRTSFLRLTKAGSQANFFTRTIPRATWLVRDKIFREFYGR